MQDRPHIDLKSKFAAWLIPWATKRWEHLRSMTEFGMRRFRLRTGEKITIWWGTLDKIRLEAAAYVKVWKYPGWSFNGISPYYYFRNEPYYRAYDILQPLKENATGGAYKVQENLNIDVIQSGDYALVGGVGSGGYILQFSEHPYQLLKLIETMLEAGHTGHATELFRIFATERLNVAADKDFKFYKNGAVWEVAQLASVSTTQSVSYLIKDYTFNLVIKKWTFTELYTYFTPVELTFNVVSFSGVLDVELPYAIPGDATPSFDLPYLAPSAGWNPAFNQSLKTPSSTGSANYFYKAEVNPTAPGYIITIRTSINKLPTYTPTAVQKVLNLTDVTGTGAMLNNINFAGVKIGADRQTYYYNERAANYWYSQTNMNQRTYFYNNKYQYVLYRLDLNATLTDVNFVNLINNSTPDFSVTYTDHTTYNATYPAYQSIHYRYDFQSGTFIETNRVNYASQVVHFSSWYAPGSHTTTDSSHSLWLTSSGVNAEIRGTNYNEGTQLYDAVEARYNGTSAVAGVADNLSFNRKAFLLSALNNVVQPQAARVRVAASQPHLEILAIFRGYSGTSVEQITPLVQLALNVTKDHYVDRTYKYRMELPYRIYEPTLVAKPPMLISAVIASPLTGGTHKVYAASPKNFYDALGCAMGAFQLTNTTRQFFGGTRKSRLNTILSSVTFTSTLRSLITPSVLTQIDAIRTASVAANNATTTGLTYEEVLVYAKQYADLYVQQVDELVYTPGMFDHPNLEKAWVAMQSGVETISTLLGAYGEYWVDDYKHVEHAWLFSPYYEQQFPPVDTSSTPPPP